MNGNRLLISHRRCSRAARKQTLTRLLAASSSAFLILCSAQAATYTVTSTADTGAVGTLRWAITQANADPGSTINIQDNLGTITLTSPSPQVTAAMMINGGTGNTVNGGLTKLGSGELILSGDNSFTGAFSPSEGTLTINGGVTTAQTTGIAADGGTATLAVTGSGANWTSQSDIYLGLNGGTGMLIISDGATASDTFALVGRHTASDTGHVTVTGSGTTWTHSAGLVIGTGGTGTMLVSDGGHVSNTDGTIGGDAGSNGTVTVTGANSLWTSTDYLLVGGNGAGTLTVTDGGTVKVGATGAGTLTLANSGSAAGTLNIGAAANQAPAAPGTILAATITAGSGSGAKLVNFNHTDTAYTFAPQLTGGLAVQLIAGTTILTGANTYTGGTTLAGGTLNLGSANAIGTTGTISFLGGLLQYSAANTTDYSSHFSTAPEQQYRIDTGGQDVTFATGLVGADGSLSKQGAGTLTLTGANTFDQGATIFQGTLSIGNGGTTGSITGDIWNRAALVFNRSDSTTWSGFLSGGGSVTKLGAGELSLTGGASSMGLFAIRQGSAVSTASSLDFDTMEVGSSAGDSGSFTLQSGSSVMNSATIGRDTGSSGTVTASGGSWLVDNLTVGVGGAGGLTVGGGYVTTHHLVLGQDADSAGTITVTNGALTAYDDLSVGQSGGGTLNLSGGNVQAGTLVVAENAGSVGVVNFSGGSWSTGSGNPVSTVIGSRGDGTFTLDTATYSASGTSLGRYDGGSGTLTLNTGGQYTENYEFKVGHEGTGVLNVNGGTYSGASAANYIGYLGDGTVNLTRGTFDVGGGTVYLGYYAGSSGTLNIGNGTTVGTLTAGEVNGGAGSAVVNFNHTGNVIFGTPLTGSLSVNKLGTGMLTLSGPNTYTGGTTINDGTLSLGSTGTLATTGNVTTAGGTLDLGANRSHTFGALSLTGGTVVGTDTALTVSSFSGSGGQVAGLTSLTSTQTGDTTFSGVLSATRLILDGPGTLTLDGSDDNVGATATVNAGTLVLAKAGTPGVTHAIGNNLIINSGGTVKIAGSTGDQIYKDAPVVVNTGGTLDLNGRDESLGSLTGAGTVTNSVSATTSTLTLGENVGGAFTFSGALTDGAGTLALTKIGSGTLTLAGANTYSGSTTVNAGTLQFANRDAFNVASAGTLSVASAATAAFNVGGANEFTTSDLGTISTQGTFSTGSLLGLDTTRASGGTFSVDAAQLGSVDLAKLGTGTLALGSANAFAGNIQIAAGTVDTGASAIDLAHFSGTGTLTGTGNFGYDSASDYSLGVALDGSASLAKLGTGTLTLSSANTYTGPTTVNAGTLQFDTRSSLYNGDTASWTAANFTVASGATAFFNIGGDGAFTAADITTLSSLGTASGGFRDGSSIGLDLRNFIEYDGILSNPNSGANHLGLVVKGEGWLILNNANTYTGGTTINDAVIYLNDNGALPTGGDLTLMNNGVFDLGVNHNQTIGALTVNGGTIFGNDSTTLTVSSFSGSDGLVNPGSLISTQTGDTTFSGALWNTLLTLDGSGTLTLDGPGSGNHVGVSAIVNAGTLVLAKTDTPTIDVGLTINSGGTVRIAGSTGDQIYKAAPVVVNAGGTLDLNGRDESLGSFTGGGTVTNTATGTASTLTVGEDTNADLAFSGAMQDGAGTLALTKIGTGTFTLTGENTFTGGTTISTGTLSIGDGGTTGSISGDIANNAALTFNRSDASAYAGVISGTGTLTKLGSGTLVLTGDSTYTGTTTINGGKLVVDGSIASSSLTRINNGGTLGGSGTVGAVTINSGGTISPGNSPGTMNTNGETWNGGGSYAWELNDATGTAGTNWDILSIGGSLDIAATGLGGANKFTIYVTSLDGSNVGGHPALNFNSLVDQSWVIATTTGAITGYSDGKFAIDTSAFFNATDPNSSWHLSVVPNGGGNNLVLTYTAVPEPSTYAIGIVALLGGAILMRRRRTILRK